MDIVGSFITGCFVAGAFCYFLMKKLVEGLYVEIYDIQQCLRDYEKAVTTPSELDEDDEEYEDRWGLFSNEN